MYVVGEEFDTWNGKLLVEKYVPVAKIPQERNTGKRYDKKLKKFHRMIDGQFKFHEKTTQLRANMHKISPCDIISITNKLHGTSWVVGNVVTKKKLTRVQRILKWLGVPIVETMYDTIYSSRSVVQNAYINPNTQSYYKGDVYGEVKRYIGDRVPKGFTLYGEVVGYTSTGSMIQKNYDYGYVSPILTVASGSMSGMRETYEEGKHFGVYVYRITYTNIDGNKIELSWGQIKEYCNYYGLKHVPELYYGHAQYWADLHPEEHWHATALALMQGQYLEKDCDMCSTKVPAEGVVVRKDGLYNFEAYKLKSFRFLEGETKLLDEGETNIEDEQGIE